jgi:hypothetical protein
MKTAELRQGQDNSSLEGARGGIFLSRAFELLPFTRSELSLGNGKLPAMLAESNFPSVP